MTHTSMADWLARRGRAHPRLALAMWFFQPDPGTPPFPEPGAHVIALLLGLFFTIAAFAVGIGYWLWRRERGPLRRSDHDVLALGSSDDGYAAHEPFGSKHILTDEERRAAEITGTGPPRAGDERSDRPDAPRHAAGAPGAGK